jgi:hypothetical protein
MGHAAFRIAGENRYLQLDLEDSGNYCAGTLVIGGTMPDRFHQIVVFENANFEGSHKHIFRSLPYIGDDLNDKTSSFAVLGGAWSLYKDSNYQNVQGGVFAPRVRGYASVTDYEVANDAVSSLELVDDDPRSVPQLILFTEELFGGNHYHAFNDVYNLERYQSYFVLSGNWQVTTKNGNTFMQGPGGNNAPPGDKLATMHLVSETPNPDVFHLIVFSDSQFEGDHLHVFQSTTFDGDWGKQISSFVVESGFWRFAFHRSPNHLVSGQQMSRGIYPWVEDVDIPNDATYAVSNDFLQPAGTSHVVQNLNNGEDVLTFHGDPYRLGWNSQETTLTPENVRVPYFGKLWFHPFDADERVYAQLLLASGVQNAAGAAPVDYLIAASAKNVVYALSPTDGSLIWQTNLLLPDGVTQAGFLDANQFNTPLKSNCEDTFPNHGVNGTPVIDKALQIIYVAFIASKDDTANYNQAYYLSALALTSGAVLWTIELTFGGPPIPFQPYMHTQQAALALIKGGPLTRPAPGPDLILIEFSARCDVHGHGGETSRGWLFAVPVLNGAMPAAGSWQALPMTVGTSLEDATGGGISGPGGAAVDDIQTIFLSTGNGDFDGNTGGQDFADSLVSFTATNIAFPPKDGFTPRNWQDLEDNRLDFGASNPILLPTQYPAPNILGIFNVAMVGGKDGRVYFVNTDDMGFRHYTNAVTDGLGYSLWRPQIFSGNSNPSQGGIATSAAYFDAGGDGRYVYLCSASGSPYQGMVAIKFDDMNGETQLGTQVLQFGGGQMNRPASPFVSSNGPTNGIVWAVETRHDDTDHSPTPSILHAWDAVSGRLLYSSPLTTEFGITGAGESLGDGRKYTPPIVVNGKVFIGTNGVVAYGLGQTD